MEDNKKGKPRRRDDLERKGRREGRKVRCEGQRRGKDGEVKRDVKREERMDLKK